MTDLAAILDGYFNGGTVPTNLYVGLVSAENYDAFDPQNDTMSSHPGWEEFTDYDEAARQEWVPGNTVDGYPASINNPGSVRVTPNLDGTCVGVFLTTSSTKGGTTGQLYGPWPIKDGYKNLVEGIPFKIGIKIKLKRNTV